LFFGFGSVCNWSGRCSLPSQPPNDAQANSYSPFRSPEDIVRRLDALITEIKDKYHRACFEHPDQQKGDVLVVAHGHILRAFAMRWVGKPLNETSLILEAGGVGTLR
jgi:broad specificity phosphatase PhoE